MVRIFRERGKRKKKRLMCVLNGINKIKKITKVLAEKTQLPTTATDGDVVLSQLYSNLLFSLNFKFLSHNIPSATWLHNIFLGFFFTFSTFLTDNSNL